MNKLKNHLALALDHLTKEEALNLIMSTKEQCGLYKIGLELFIRYGREIIEEANQYNIDIFLDLKLHDIPNTVFQAIKSLEGLQIKYLTIHLLGGSAMLKKALEARDLYLPNTKLLGVSLLTSHDQLDFNETFGIANEEQLNEAFIRLFELAQNNQIDGVVHAGSELKLAQSFSFFSVCPGIRFKDEILNGELQDQKRVMSPELAFKSGAKIIVIGRSLTSPKSSEVFDARLEELNAALTELK